MIDQSYFTDKFHEQSRKMKGLFSLRIHLHGGTTVEVSHLESAEPDYVLVQAYPLDGSDAQADKSNNPVIPMNGPRLSIPYESIAFVELTHEKKKGIGFQMESNA